MRLDLEALLKSGKALEVARLAVSVTIGCFVYREVKFLDPVLGEHTRNNNYLEITSSNMGYLIEIVETGAVRTWGRVRETDSHELTHTNNYPEIIALLQPFDLDDRIEDEKDIENLLFDEYECQIFDNKIALKGLIVKANKDKLQIYSNHLEQFVYYGDIPTSKAFARQLLHSLGITPKGGQK